MQDMRFVNNFCCSLSKGTQSDGLISDTSTEGFTSGSSTENLKEGKIFEKPVAKETELVRDESENSKSSTYSKPSTSLHQIQNQYRLYIRWSVLLSFGILLWVALWITDIFNPNPFLKEGWLVDVATAKKITLRAGIVKTAVPSTWWFFNLWSYACNSVISVTTLEILVFLCCVTILVYLEAHVKNKWGGTIPRLCYDQFYKSFLTAGAEESETDSNSFHFKIFDDVLAPKEPDIKSSGDDLSKFSYGDVRNLTTQDDDDTKVKSKLKETCTQYLNQGQTSSIENRISKSLKGSHDINNIRKRSLQVNGDKNYCNFSRRSNNQSQEIVSTELILNKPNFDLSCTSSMSENDKAKQIPDHSNLTCSIFNKSTSFMSEEIETWFELPDSNQAETVMHSFDMELEKFFKYRSSSPPLSVEKSTQDRQRIYNSSVDCECGKRSKAVSLNIHYNGGIVSSSPEFRRFLVNLAKDRLSEP